MMILYIGRFQPFHNGHLEAVRRLSQTGGIIIAIGSAQYDSSFRNPFSYTERARMIRGAVEEAGLEVTEIVPVKDIHDHQRWAGHVKASVPHYDAIFTNSETDRHIFGSAGENVLEKWYFERERYEGKKIREAIATGAEWKDKVPPAVERILVDIGAEKRLKDLREHGPLEEEV
jgi:nicotinamide-nucleotide adenylyltransferase